jgi:hypothetical protein
MGCYRTTNVATLTPLHTVYPVSASSQYVAPGGAIVTEKQYQVVQPFSFQRAIQAAPHEETLTALALQPDLDRIMSTSRGDAITDMRISATNYDAGSHGPAAGWKILGWTFGLTGATLAVTGLAVGDNPETGTSFGTDLVVTGPVTLHAPWQ